MVQMALLVFLVTHFCVNLLKQILQNYRALLHVNCGKQQKSRIV